MFGEPVVLDDRFRIDQRRQFDTQFLILDEIIVSDLHGHQVFASVPVAPPTRLELYAVADAVIEPVSADVHQRVAAKIAHQDAAIQISENFVVGDHGFLVVGHVHVVDLLLPVLPEEGLPPSGQIEPNSDSVALIGGDERIGNVSDASCVADVQAVAVVEGNPWLGDVDVSSAVQDVHAGNVLVIGHWRSLQQQLTLDIFYSHTSAVVVVDDGIAHIQIVPLAWNASEKALQFRISW